VLACDQPDAFSRVIHSATLPIDVHFAKASDAPEVRAALATLEEAWPQELALGFRAAPDDGGACGEDGRFDVFAWRGLDEMYVDLIDYTQPSAPYATYMVIDPWGSYGGDELRSTMYHELNHTMQGADDWDEPAIVFEATAQMIEVIFAPETDTFSYTVPDFQAFPEWSIDHDDGYETWFMYGAALFFIYLSEERFHDDAYLGEMWDRSSGSDTFEDALDFMLGQLDPPSTFEEEVVAFAKWRYTDAPARGWGRPYVDASPGDAQAMAYGTVYARVPAGQTAVVGGAEHIAQTFDDDGDTVIAVTVMPLPGEESPFARDDTMFDVPITFE
jgi:hypothetical protein